ncbi:type 1 glutamine amidotransferase family protein [Paenibacillus sp. TAB 01]|uniref:type 1 glutamine amidotransferase family protein n=1 Tax=Paenibacillus sp. TAB 01 TaxID=3368988 RepID=UPI00375271E1
MKSIILIALTEGFADWEASYVSAELNKPGRGLRVRTIGIDKNPKTSMGGLQVLPHDDLNGFDELEQVAMLILPGGTGWAEPRHEPFRTLIESCFQRDIPVAAICDATSFLGKYGFLEHCRHTGNTLSLLKQHAPGYTGDANYVEAQSVSDGNVITANGSAAVEFARDILQKLGALEGEDLAEWYHICKHGFLPA